MRTVQAKPVPGFIFLCLALCGDLLFIKIFLYDVVMSFMYIVCFANVNVAISYLLICCFF